MNRSIKPLATVILLASLLLGGAAQATASASTQQGGTETNARHYHANVWVHRHGNCAPMGPCFV